MNIKKLSLVTIAVLFSILTQAQVKFGAKAGINIAFLTGAYPAGTSISPKLGLHLGVVTVIPFTGSKLSFAPEFLYSMQGTQQHYKQDSFVEDIGFMHEEQEQKLTLSYINIPLMFRYNVIKQLSVDFGPQFGVAVGAKSVIEYTNSAIPQENSKITISGFEDGTIVLNGTTYSYTNTLKRFDAGVNIGATYNINKSIFAQARYNLGLTDVEKRLVAGKMVHYRNSVVQLSIGYLFN